MVTRLSNADLTNAESVTPLKSTCWRLFSDVARVATEAKPRRQRPSQNLKQRDNTPLSHALALPPVDLTAVDQHAWSHQVTNFSAIIKVRGMGTWFSIA